MGILNKNENWWLRLTIVIITIISLSTLAHYNKEITIVKVKSQSDSTLYYKMQYDTISNELDSVKLEVMTTRNTNARIELGVNYYIDDESHKQMKEDRNFVSKFTKEKRINAAKRIEFLRTLNDYPLCSWIVAFELYKKEEPKISAEIEEFINHLTE